MKVSKIQGLLITLFCASICYAQNSLAQVNQNPPPSLPATQTPSTTVSQPSSSAVEQTPTPTQQPTTGTKNTYQFNWGYSGSGAPTNWGNLSAEFATCGIGKSQSPININVSDALPNSENRLQINYSSSPLEIVKDGSSTYNINGKSLTLNDGQSVQLNFPASGPKETITFNNVTYHLVQLHFHTPAENQLNGKQFPGEIHLVNQGPNGKLTVIGVFIKSGEKNPVLERVLTNLPQEKGKIVNIKDTYIDPASLLPTNKSYFSFLGSLTTPPCTEGVEWIVMEQPIEASVQQLKQLRFAIHEDNDRPVQPLNNRRIMHVTM